MSDTNTLTKDILNFLFVRGIFAYRQNTGGVPIHRNKQIVGMRPAPMTGIPDIQAVLPPNGRSLGIEVKTGRDKIRPEQAAFHANVRRCGGAIIIAKTMESFIIDFKEIYGE